MKFLSLVLISMAIGSAHAKDYFQCDDAPPVRWGTYFCVYGAYDSQGSLSEVEYGTCSGSDDAGEAEPNEIIEFASLKPNPELKATSKEWRDAFAYDLTTKEHGAAILFLQPTALKKNSKVPARLKVRVGSKEKNIILRCSY